MPNVRRGESGHGGTLPGIVLAVIGAIALSIGAVGDTGWLTITGGIVLAVGLVGMNVLHHMVVDYDIYARLDKLEKK
jgi:hypothetical protein